MKSQTEAEVLRQTNLRVGKNTNIKKDTDRHLGIDFCGLPATLEGPLSFHLSSCLYGCTDVCTDVRSRQHQKINLRSLMRTQ